MPNHNPIKFQYMSDIHLEVRPGFRLTTSDVLAPYLILAGDIGCTSTPEQSDEYISFLQSCSELFYMTFLIAGNHEGYGHKSWLAAKVALRGIAKHFTNIILMDHTVYDIPNSDIRVAGTTLWSHILTKESVIVRYSMMDYREIGGGFGIGDSNHLHTQDLAWLTSIIPRTYADGKRLVVVTHHAPSFKGTSHPKHEGNNITSAFASELDMMLSPPICVWVHGHTHYSHSTPNELGTLLLSNQRGYSAHNEEGFKRNAMFMV